MRLVEQQHFSQLSNFPLSFFPTSHINEDKRKTEGQKQIFDVVYEVDGCPVSLRISADCMSVIVLTNCCFFEFV